MHIDGSGITMVLMRNIVSATSGREREFIRSFRGVVQARDAKASSFSVWCPKPQGPLIVQHGNPIRFHRIRTMLSPFSLSALACGQLKVLEGRSGPNSLSRALALVTSHIDCS